MMVFLATMLIIFIIIALSSLSQFQKYEQVRKTDEKIENLNITFKDMFITDADFFNVEGTNVQFYKTGESSFLTIHDSLLRKASFNVQLELKQGSLIEEDLRKTKSALTNYDSSFKQIVEAIKERGFKDFGLEGDLRKHAHNLEDFELVTQLEVLTLRRHEKDYMLRHEKGYIDKFDALISDLNRKYQGNSLTIFRIENYSSALHKFIDANEKIGFNNQMSMKGDLHAKVTELIITLNRLELASKKLTSEAYEAGINIFMASIAIGGILSIILLLRLLKKV